MIERPHASRLGEVVGGKYRIARFLAEGGMGVVYEAQHTVVKRRFAVKFLRRALAERRDILQRFQREAQAAGELESENLTAAVDFGIAEDGTPFIVMEYLVGENLARLLEREGPLPVARAADLIAQACRGIQAAHAAGIVHRDLKPQNLFVCRRDDGTDLLKVLDFGVAKLEASGDNSIATVTGMVLGTPAYMSPEQARGDKVIDHRADVYALAAILYELLCGQKPHPGDSHNAILYHISTQPAVPLDSVRADLPAALVEIIDRALASDPAARHQTVETLGQALAPLARREVWRAPPREETSTPAPADPALADTVNPPARRRGRARSFIALGAFLVASIVVITIGAVRGAKAPPPPAPPPPVAVERPSPAPERTTAATIVAPARAAPPDALPVVLEVPPRPSGAGQVPRARVPRRVAEPPPAAKPPEPTPLPAAPPRPPPPVTLDPQNPYN